MPGLRPLRRGSAPGGRGSIPLRFLDRTLGAAMLGALGALRRKRPIPERLDRIGIMKSTGIGDMILATAGVRDIAEAFPDAEIVLFAGADNADLARLVPGVRVVELAASRPWRTLPRLRAERLDALIDLGQWTRLEALYAGLSGARWTAGFATPGQRRHYAYDATVSHSSDVRELDNFRRLVALLGLEPTSMPSFHPTRASDRPPPPVDGPYAVLHMWPGGYRSELREWPAPSWRTLAEIIGARGCSMVLTGGPGDVDRTAAFVASCDGLDLPLFPVAGRYRLHELVDVLATARCVVSVNTGVMHLAAATGVPTIALNGPTSSLRWGPVGPRAISLDSDFPGCGFLNLGSEYDGQRTDCMEGISVERVAAAVLEQIRD